MSNIFPTVAAAVLKVKPVWLALADNGAVFPGVAGRFVIGNPTGQIVTVTAKTFPKDAIGWEPTDKGAVIRTKVGTVTLPDAPGVSGMMAQSDQEEITGRVAAVTGPTSATIAGKVLADVLTACAPCAAAQDKAVINDILLHIEPGAAVAVATDGYRLVERVIDDVNGATFEARINSHDAKHLAALLKVAGYPLVRLALMGDRLTIIGGDIGYFGSPACGQYPAYKQILPATFETRKITVSTKELIDALKAVTIKSKIPTLTIEAVTGYGLTFSSREGDNVASVSVAADVTEDYRAVFNPDLLSSTVKALGADSVVIYPGVSPLSPVVARPLAGSSRALVMPVNPR